MSRSLKLPDNGAESCPLCGECWPLTRQGICYQCVCKRDGRKYTELHHPLGRDNPIVADIVIEIPGNWHRALDARRTWRPAILKRPGDNPLHQIAAAIVTFGEVADVVADFARRQDWPSWASELAEFFGQVAHFAADWLLILAGKLDERCGPGWISEMPEWRP